MFRFKGQFLFIWRLPNVMGGNNITSKAGRDHVLKVMDMLKLSFAPIKVADGYQEYNHTQAPLDLYKAMADKGYPRVGWMYNYGYNPTAEADYISQRIYQFDLEGLILDPEQEYKTVNRNNAAIFMSRLRKNYPNLPIALCSYRYPTYHPIPWSGFLAYMKESNGDVHMPQLYWEQDSRPNAPTVQMERSHAELTSLSQLPYCPVGCAYDAGSWSSTPAQMKNMSQAAKGKNSPCIGWWSWDYIAQTEGHLPPGNSPKGRWKALLEIAEDWQGEPTIPEPPAPVTLEERVASLERRVDNLESNR